MSETETVVPPASITVPTDLAYGLAHAFNCPMAGEYKMADVVPILNTMYPGINYWWSLQSRVCRDIAQPDVAAQHPILLTFTFAAQAVKTLGPEIKIGFVRECAGYDWQGWEVGVPHGQALTC